MNTNPNATRILCFGDSNTYGLIDIECKKRFKINERYPGILQNLLGLDYEVIEEGLPSRTISSKDTRKKKIGKQGHKYFFPCIDSHEPLDFICLYIGNNELKDQYKLTPNEIAKKLENNIIKPFIKKDFRYKKPNLIIIGTSLITKQEYENSLYKNAIEKSLELPKSIEKIANKYNIPFINVTDLKTSKIDGLHLTNESHKKLAKKIYNKIREIEN
jgi:lysophospholipase L1-like esterase